MLAEGKISQWGVFAGGGAGYAIGDGTAIEVQKLTMQFRPYVHSHIHPVLSVDELTEVMKSMKG